MYDRFNRTINYLRISVTDRCNLRCRYCMPEEGIHLLKHEDILSYDEITMFTRIAAGYGFKKIRITGGEPLVRKGIVNLIRMISSIDGIEDLSMTTNGILLEAYARQLSESGLGRVNISLDTVDPLRYRYITRTGDLANVLKGIEAAKKAGLVPVKINCVVKESGNEPDALAVADFCRRNDLEVRFIKEMDLALGRFSTVDGGTGGICYSCNRLRLTANGKLKPCLFNNEEIDIRTVGYHEAIRMAIERKPEEGQKNSINKFYNIGG